LAPNVVAYNAVIGIARSHYNMIPDAGLHHHHGMLSSLESHFLSLTIQWTAFCVLMQLGTNLHNDYADFVLGADDDKRVGQPRATQKGWLTPRQTATASGVTLFAGFLLGMSFPLRMLLLMGVDETTTATTTTTAHHHAAILFMAFVVVSSVFNAFAYTGGPWPLGYYLGLPPTFSIGYAGLGDLFVFLYFGLVATLIPPFLFVTLLCRPNGGEVEEEEYAATMITVQNRLLWACVPHAVQVAALSTNIIVVNNLRDRHTDVGANKRTLAVRFGASVCRVEYGVMLLLAYGIQLHDAVWMHHFHHAAGADPAAAPSLSFVRLLPFLSLPLAWKEWRALYTKDGPALNQHVGGSAKVQLFFCILLATSLRLSSSSSSGR
jgi:1,4-dihydroxy-2-naphthoate polyprenyltransferase